MAERRLELNGQAGEPDDDEDMVEPRPTRRTGVESFSPCALRAYEMTVAGATVDQALKASARPLIKDFTAEMPERVGFVIYHRARPANFVLAHLWDGVDLIQRYWTAPLNDPTALVPHRAGAIGCLWELEIIAAERNAWAAACQTEGAGAIYLAAP